MSVPHFDVIIAGAGPTGLLLATQLHRFGVSYMILDKKTGPTTESRALVVQARSLEIYQQLGISDEVEKNGRASNGISVYKKGRKVTSVFLRSMGGTISPFPYVMIYEQSKNEELLYGFLKDSGQEVHWNTDLTKIEEREGGYLIWTNGNNTEASYSCNYLIGCDGGNSKVRAFSGVPFTGGTYENIFYVADTHIKSGVLSPEMLAIFLTWSSITLVFPMPGQDRFRLLGVLPKEYYHRTEIKFDEIIDEIKKNMQQPLEFYDTQWYSTYRLHYKKVDRFSKGNLFFAGDAAHVHSPAGGQGMNTGLQDAYNLGWKLALVTRGQAGAALLDSYDAERTPIAEQLLKTTDRVFSIMTSSNSFFGFLKIYVVPRFIPFFNKFDRMRRFWFKVVSQTSIEYRSSSLSKGKAGKIVAGDRLPYFKLTQEGELVSLYELIRGKLPGQAPFLFLLFGLAAESLSSFDKKLFSTLSLDNSEANRPVMSKAGLPKTFILLVRPDNYIGYISEKVDANSIRQFLCERYYLRESSTSPSSVR